MALQSYKFVCFKIKKKKKNSFYVSYLKEQFLIFR